MDNSAGVVTSAAALSIGIIKACLSHSGLISYPYGATSAVVSSQTNPFLCGMAVIT